MPDDGDLMQASQSAAQAGKDMLVEAIRGMKTRTVRPALSIKATDEEYLADYAVWTGNPEAFAATLDELSARHQLSPERPIPRRAIMRIQDSERLLRRRAKKSQEVEEDES